MSRLIDINTDTLRMLADSAGRTNDCINEAAAKLKSITQHYDWNCKERDRINEYTMENIAHVQKLQVRTRNFLDTIEAVSRDFSDAELRIAGMFGELERLLANIRAIPTAVTITNNHNSVQSTIERILSMTGAVNKIKAAGAENIKLWSLS